MQGELPGHGALGMFNWNILGMSVSAMSCLHDGIYIEEIYIAISHFPFHPSGHINC